MAEFDDMELEIVQLGGQQRYTTQQQKKNIARDFSDGGEKQIITLK